MVHLTQLLHFGWQMYLARDGNDLQQVEAWRGPMKSSGTKVHTNKKQRRKRDRLGMVIDDNVKAALNYFIAG